MEVNHEFLYKRSERKIKTEISKRASESKSLFPIPATTRPIILNALSVFFISLHISKECVFNIFNFLGSLSTVWIT